MAYTTINKHTDYFNTKLYTGTGSSNAITGVGFQPDFTWIKNRATTGNHALFNSISGVTKYINSNTNYAEQTSAQTLTAFGTDGFTVGTRTVTGIKSPTMVGLGRGGKILSRDCDLIIADDIEDHTSLQKAAAKSRNLHLQENFRKSQSILPSDWKYWLSDNL